jgi:valyl-tRNA synthetase
MFAPYLPYIAEEIWSWAYDGDAGMAPSVHRSPWPRVEEFADVIPPSQATLYAESLRVIDIVRKAKSDNNISIKAPVTKLEVKAKTAALAELLDLSRGDVQRMLSIEEYVIVLGHDGEGDMGVVVGLELPEA